MGPVEAAAEERRPEVRNAARWLDINPALSDAARTAAQVYVVAGLALLDATGADTPELTRALWDLVAAKDSGVRAALAGSGRR